MAGSSRQNDRTSVFLEHEQLSSRPGQMCVHALEAASVFLPQIETQIYMICIKIYICRRMAGSSKQSHRPSGCLAHERLFSQTEQMCIHALGAASVFPPNCPSEGAAALQHGQERADVRRPAGSSAVAADARRLAARRMAPCCT